MEAQVPLAKGDCQSSQYVGDDGQQETDDESANEQGYRTGTT